MLQNKTMKVGYAVKLVYAISEQLKQNLLSEKIGLIA